ncbi:MAG: hypothetical protein J7480_04065 [Microbacteriaceae bacterium]|nr:hypothetical protein [Microbacteriaceae bacterium]
MDAYPVPFRVDRSRAPRYRIVNSSLEPLRWVRVEMDGPGVATARLTPRLEPGAAIDVVVRGRDLALSSRLCIRWLRPNGEEYLWGIAF